MHPIQNVNIQKLVPLVSPQELKDQMPSSELAADTVYSYREQVKRILMGEDSRMLCVVGPCSIHDYDAAMDYAKRLKALADEVSDQLLLVMRVYFEKPRTTVGWKGLINDPHLNDTFAMGDGLRLGRRILLQIAELGLPAATEMLEPITPQYIADLITLASIGARTTESPTHRQMASGLSMPVGYKNGTDGSLDVALNAMQSAGSSHAFLGIDQDGKTCVVHTKGNPWGHLILRGGRSGPNYSAVNIRDAAERLKKAKLTARILVDCSHANSNKDYRKQAIAWDDVVDQRVAGNDSIVGLMLESNINPGNQKLVNPAELAYGVSITDECLGWEETERLIRSAAKKLGQVAMATTV
ncbi:MAG: 3-deoxy-7-phosphoheptulonate synthase [Planctomycetaceae bacterium]|nr:3-deoxy-7-phosphoheptulonate synthase [Planctomycetaceae bacterium]